MANNTLRGNNLGSKLGPGAELRFSSGQVVFLLLLVVLVAVSVFLYGLSTLQVFQIFVAVLTMFYVGLFFFALKVVSAGVRKDALLEITDEQAEQVDESDLPFVTVVVAAFKEAAVMSQLVDALGSLNYPGYRHQVLIVLEEKDKKTQQAIFSLSLPSNFEVVVRPSGGIMTKPAALNYLFEGGFVASDSEITVVFDAEDQPDVNQLRKAVMVFWHSWETNPNVVCVQARLAFSQNATENWLTRMLNLDYTQHFGLILPGLSSLGFISPLGGTSNYILTSVIRDLLWDPFNVTEDMDLAVRMARLGMGVRVFNSVTAEEAVNNVRDFVNQRSRWIKGGIQTYLRHMRNPIQLLNELGFQRFMSFQFGVGAPLLLNLVNPIFWGMTLLYAVTQVAWISELYPSVIFYAASAMFVAGNFVYVYMIMVAAFRTKQYGSVIYGLMVPIYWVLLSIAAFKATKEFLIPSQAHKWAKTEHKAKGMKA